MGKFLKTKEASRDAPQIASKKNSNGIVKGRVSQHKNGLKLNIDLDFEAMDYIVTKSTCKTCKWFALANMASNFITGNST